MATRIKEVQVVGGLIGVLVAACVPNWTPEPPSCNELAALCGPNGNESCCTSPLVTGGTYERSYDGVTYTDMGNPATVSDFRLDRFEITVGRFRKFVEAYPGSKPARGAGAHVQPPIANSGWDPAWNPNLVKDPGVLTTAVKCNSTYQTWTDTAGANENKPMNCITWFEAFAFCAWDGGYLPTEAEWNYVAAGGADQRVYPWSSPANSTTIDDTYAVYNCLGDGSAAGNCAFSDILNVGSKSSKGDASSGQADMAGGVWEWNLDGYNISYPNPCNDCANLTTTHRVLRGGNWGSEASDLLSSARVESYPPGRLPVIGARCARAP